MSQRTLAAQQPTYLPYLGLVHKIARADVFVVQDDLKYVKDEVSNRNRIQAGDGWKWLTIPVHRDDRSTYSSVTVADLSWADAHRRVLAAAYRGAPFASRLDELYDLIAEARDDRLSVINLATIRWLLRLFRVDVEVRVESELGKGACFTVALPRSVMLSPGDDGVVHAVPDQALCIVFGAETPGRARSVLVRPPREVAGDTGIKGSVFLTGGDVDGDSSLACDHARSFTAWVAGTSPAMTLGCQTRSNSR